MKKQLFGFCALGLFLFGFNVNANFENDEEAFNDELTLEESAQNQAFLSDIVNVVKKGFDFAKSIGKSAHKAINALGFSDEQIAEAAKSLGKKGLAVTKDALINQLNKGN